MNHHAQNILHMKPDYNAVTLKPNTAAEHWVTICAAYVTKCSVSWRLEEAERADCHAISTPAVAVQGGKYNLRSWLSDTVALRVMSMGQKGQEGVNVGDLTL